MFLQVHCTLTREFDSVSHAYSLAVSIKFPLTSSKLLVREVFEVGHDFFGARS